MKIKMAKREERENHRDDIYLEKCKYLPEFEVHSRSLEEESREKMEFWYITLKFLDFYTMGKKDHRKEFG